MNFFATSLQIASEWDVEHDQVLKIIDEMPHPDFKEHNIQIFEANEFRLAQMTEPGYNATVFYLPRNDDNRENLLTFRERLFQNKAPVLSQAAPAAPQAQSAPLKISNEAREKAEAMIKNGELDSTINNAFSEVHKTLISQLGGDPGYQNVRAYMKARRSALGG